MENNIPVHIWSGLDYLPQMHEPALYGPPNTFRTIVNDTFRRPLKLKLETMTHKTGVILNDFNTPCGLNALIWSSAGEHNYFTTHRYWLLITDDMDDLKSLEDFEIFLPPDSEVRILIQSPEEDAVYSLIDIYKVAEFKELKRNVMSWKFSTIEEMISSLQTYGSVISLREDLEGITFNTGLVIAFPDMFTNIEDLSLRHIDTISKVNNRLTLELAHKLNMR